jgi:hypothetical protein
MASERDIAASRERRAWIEAENKRVRNAEDQAQYANYEQQMKSERLTPLPYEQWAKLLPEEDDPVVRGTFASNRAAWTQFATVTKERVASQSLDDDELVELGFDVRFRPNWELEYTSHGVAAMFEKFRERESRFVPSLQFRPVGDFLLRNKLILSGPHIEIAFALLWNLNLIAPKPEPEPEARKVNLAVEPDPALIERKRREEYGTKIAVTGPDGRGYTQFELDRLGSDEYKSVMRLFGDRQPRFSNVISPA